MECDKEPQSFHSETRPQNNSQKGLKRSDCLVHPRSLLKRQLRVKHKLLQTTNVEVSLQANDEFRYSA